MMKNVFFWLVAISVAWGEVAEGQTPVQPVYTRVAKSKGMPVFSAVTLSGATNSTSDVYDWTAFSTVQYIITLSTTANVCSFVPQIYTQQGMTASTITAIPPFDGNSVYTPYTNSGEATFVYTVSNLQPYIRVNMLAVAGLGATSCTATVSIVGQPFTLGVDVEGVYAPGRTTNYERPLIVGGTSNGGAGGGTAYTAQVDSAGALLVDISGGGTGGPVNLTQVASSSTGLTGTGAAGAATQRVVTATDSTIASVTSLDLAQNSVTSGQTGPLVQGAATTTQPSYTTARTNPLSLTLTGALRTAESATATASAIQAPVSCTGAADIVFTADNTICEVTLQNVSNVVAFCGGTSSTDSTTYNFILKAGTAAADGTGGSATFHSGASWYCTTAAGTTIIAVTAVKCPGN